MRAHVFSAALFLASTAPALTEDARDHFALCAHPLNKERCIFEQGVFRDAFTKAYQGDYQGQRNVAFCLEDSCSGAIVRNPSLACAWRMVIIGMGSSRNDATDRANVQNACTKLDPLAFEAAKAQASRLGQVIQVR